MEKLNYKILKKIILNVRLISLTSQNWYNSNDEITSWSDYVYIGPNVNNVVYNISGGTVTEGYYKWDGTTWISVTETEANESYNLPIFLEDTLDVMGGMVQFNGFIEQIEQIVNFTYTQTGSTIQIYGSTNPDKLRQIIEQSFTINWGDGSTDNLVVNQGIIGNALPTLSHTYSTSSGYTITISLDSPWTKQKLEKKVTIPKDITVSNSLGTFTGVTVPAYSNLTGQTQNYLYDFDYTVGYTGYTTFNYLAIGKSRISEKKLYGSNQYSGVTTGVTEGIIYSAYTIDGLYYRDLSNGYTSITGSTSAYTKEEAFNTLLTRNEHFLGFIEDPIIYSDIFVERGKQNVTEKNLRLGEIDSTGEIDLYGNGYFPVRKQ
jgi:hypothetical protein